MEWELNTNIGDLLYLISILCNFQLRTTRMVQEFESSAFQAHDKEDYRKVWDHL